MAGLPLSIPAFGGMKTASGVISASHPSQLFALPAALSRSLTLRIAAESAAVNAADAEDFVLSVAGFSPAQPTRTRATAGHMLRRVMTDLRDRK